MARTKKAGLGEYLRSILPQVKRKHPEQQHALELRLARRNQLVQQLSNKKQEASGIGDELNRLRFALNVARGSARGWETAQGENAKHRLTAADADQERLTAQIEEEEARLSVARDEIEGLQKSIQDATQGASVDEVKAYLSVLQAQLSQIAQLEGLIRESESQVSPVDSGEEELAALQQAREDLLADIAAGNAKREQLDALDAQVSEILSSNAGQQAEAKTKERDHLQTLAGLRRRLSAAQDRHAELLNQNPAVIEQLLIAQAASVYEHYVATAEALMTSFHQLQGLQEVLMVAVPESRVRLLSPAWPRLLIPSASGSVSPNHAGEHLYIGSEACHKEVIRVDRQRALAALTDAGVAETFPVNVRLGILGGA